MKIKTFLFACLALLLCTTASKAEDVHLIVGETYYTTTMTGGFKVPSAAEITKAATSNDTQTYFGIRQWSGTNQFWICSVNDKLVSVSSGSDTSAKGAALDDASFCLYGNSTDGYYMKSKATGKLVAFNSSDLTSVSLVATEEEAVRLFVDNGLYCVSGSTHYYLQLSSTEAGALTWAVGTASPSGSPGKLALKLVGTCTETSTAVNLNSEMRYRVQTREAGKYFTKNVQTANTYINLTTYAYTNEGQTWKFKNGQNNGVKFSNATDANTVYGSNSVADGSEKVWAIADGTEDYTTEFIGETYNSKYALKAYGSSTYLSNFGGASNNMGFYNTLNDNGTLLTIEPVVKVSLTAYEADNTNTSLGSSFTFDGVTSTGPFFIPKNSTSAFSVTDKAIDHYEVGSTSYTAAAFTDLINDATTTDIEAKVILAAGLDMATPLAAANAAKMAIGDNHGKVGYVNEVTYQALVTAITNAESASEATDALITALNTANNAAKDVANVVYPEAGKLYTLQAQGSYNLTSKSWETGKPYLCDKTTAAGSAMAVETTVGTPSEPFYFTVSKVSDGVYTLSSLATGRYLNQSNSSTTAVNITFTAKGDGGFTLKDAAKNPYIACTNGTLNYWNGDVAQRSWILTEIQKNVLTITSSPATVKANFTYNGETKTGTSASFSINSGQTPTSTDIAVTPADDTYTFSSLLNGSGESVTTWDGTASLALTANFGANFYSSTYGEKWVHLTFANNTSYNIATVNTTETGTRSADLSADSQLWCFVGTASSFKIYNKASGNAYALNAEGVPANGTNTSMVDANSACSWTLGTGLLGYSILKDGYTEFGLNAYAGVGNTLQFYGAMDQGSSWLIEDASLEITANNAGLDASSMTDENARIAKAQIAYGDKTISFAITKDNYSSAIKIYLPKGTTYNLTVPYVYRNYTSTSVVKASDTDNTFALTFADALNGAKYLYYDGDGYNAPYRIPAITTAKNGDVIAINDRRYCGSDIGNGHIDLVGRVSKDNGLTWGADQMIADGTGTSGADDCGYGDAAVVADCESNKVLVMMASGNVNYPNSTLANPIRMARVVGTYNEETSSWDWSSPVDVTDYFYQTVFNSELTKMFIGSGRIAQSRKVKVGDYYRLYAALCCDGGNRVVYSDDFGTTWKLLGGSTATCAVDGNEPKCEELPDGSVLLSSRKAYGRYFNIFTYTDVSTGAGTWGDVVASNAQTGGISYSNNSCNGEIYMMKALRASDNKPVTLALQSIPTGSSRSDVKIYYKVLDEATDYDTPANFASSWDGSYMVASGNAGYSTFTLQHNGKIGFYWEDNSVGNSLFDMVYQPLTIAQITNNAYTEGFTRTIGEKGYASLYLDYPVYIPQGVTAYVATTVPSLVNSVNVISLTPISDGIIPANTGVVLKADASGYNFVETTERGTSVSANLLVGNMEDTQIAGSQSVSYYALGYSGSSEVGFYWPNGTSSANDSFTMEGTKSFLRLNGANASKGFVFDSDGLTGLSPIISDGNNANDDRVYDLSGKRVLNPLKGIFIKNGKQYIIK